MADRFDFCNVTVTGKSTVFVIVSRRKRLDCFCKTDKVFRLAGKQDRAGGIVSVIEGPNTDGIPGCNILSGPPVKYDAGEFRIKHGEHFYTVLKIQGKNDLAVAVRLKGIAFSPENIPHFFKSIEFAVAHDITPVKLKGLHAG